MSTAAVRRRAFGVWRRVLDLSWPVMVQHVFRTLMRTTDVVVTGLFSPAAVAAVGLAVFLLGFSYLTSVVLGWGVVGVYAGIVVHYLWMLVVIARGFVYGGWAERAATMMDERGSLDETEVDATD